MGHENRSRRTRADNPWANPTPAMIVDARAQLGLTEAEAAAAVYRRAQAWRDWEAGVRQMGPGDWMLFKAAHRPRAHVVDHGGRLAWRVLNEQLTLPASASGWRPSAINIIYPKPSSPP